MQYIFSALIEMSEWQEGHPACRISCTSIPRWFGRPNLEWPLEKQTS